MGSDKSYSVIARDLRAHGFFRWLAEKIKEIIQEEPMIIVREEVRLITDNETKNIFDIRGKKVATAKLEKEVLKITPEKNILVSFDKHKDIRAGRIYGFVKTKGNVTLRSRNRKRETVITKSTAYCHPL